MYNRFIANCNKMSKVRQWARISVRKVWNKRPTPLGRVNTPVFWSRVVITCGNDFVKIFFSSEQTFLWENKNKKLHIVIASTAYWLRRRTVVACTFAKNCKNLNSHEANGPNLNTAMWRLLYSTWIDISSIDTAFSRLKLLLYFCTEELKSR